MAADEDRWEQRRHEMLARDDRPAFWHRTLFAPPAAEDQAAAVDMTPVDVSTITPAQYAQLRSELGIDQAGLDRGQVQGYGYKGDAAPPMPGREHVRAAQALQHDMGTSVRTEYGRRQQIAAQLTRSDRSR